MKISTIYKTRIRNDKYLGYFIKKPVYYRYLFLVFLRVIKRVFSSSSRENRENSVHSRFDTPKRLEILSKVRELQDVAPNVVCMTSFPALGALELPEKQTSKRSIFIRLASIDVELRPIVFDQQFDDVEDHLAANRFIWLYEVLHASPDRFRLEQCLNLILYWIKKHGTLLEDTRHESYSISERVIAWLFFLLLTKNILPVEQKEKEVIFNSVTTQIIHLSKNLEYHGSSTNNHILNNARALYIAGRLLQNEKLATIGRDIFTNEHAMVFVDGICQEGSTHYQFLLTKNVIEMHMIAGISKDFGFQEYLDPLVSQMIKVCYGLQSQYGSGQYPLIGDISPDMTPEWFAHYPFSKSKAMNSKWFGLFKHDPRSIIPPKVPNLGNCTGEERKLKWYYLCENGFEIWVNTRSGMIPCHGHNDNGTIILFYKGRPIIIDLGLSGYIQSVDNEMQKSERAHNMPIIDGYEVDIGPNPVFYDSDLRSVCRVTKHDNSRMEYSITYANRNIRVKRELNIEKGICVITDSLEKGKGNLGYETNWHFGTTFEYIGENLFRIGELNGAIEGTANPNVEEKEEFSKSAKYGDRSLVSSLIVRSSINLKGNMCLKLQDARLG